ncbi:MAG: FAD/NAD(P)-binding protein [Acidimicrobiia bacterium]|nr:FAD/NAD(P)-binding protein [Acidimicrobiia bacterium]
MTATATATGPMAPMVPHRYRVVSRHTETSDTVTIHVEPLGDPIDAPRPGQFAMLWAFGIGEVPISFSGLPGDGRLGHTIRAVGTATSALAASEPGTVIGVRGPFGNGWDVGDADGGDVMIVAGGLGLAPLRPAVDAVLAERDRYRRAVLLIGTRSPDDLMFHDDLARWRGRLDLDVQVTVDAADTGWHGDVGVVTTLIGRVPVEPGNTLALVCGPEVMMRFTTRSLIDRGLDAERIRVSLERNMQCGVGHCGHCQLGPELVCLDGPVFAWSRVAAQSAVRER